MQLVSVCTLNTGEQVDSKPLDTSSREQNAGPELNHCGIHLPGYNILIKQIGHTASSSELAMIQM